MSDNRHTSAAPLAIMHPFVQAAIATSPDPETIRQLMALQREWEAGEARKVAVRALVELKKAMPTVLHRDADVGFAGKKGGNVAYTHTSLGAAVAAINGPLTEHGFVHQWIPSTSDRMVTVMCRLTHADGHVDSCTISAPPDNTGGKSLQQQIASTITLLERYTLLALLGIATADMKDPDPPAGDGKGEGKGDDAAADGSTNVSADRNLRAAAKLKREHGRTREEAEKYLGKPVSDWTEEDLKKLADWVVPEPGSAG